MAISRNKYTDYEWGRGNLSWLLRPHGQTSIRDFILEQWQGDPSAEPIVVNAHRRLGKSFLNVLMAVEICLRWPGMFVQYVCGEKTQVWEIVEPLLFQVLETCPPEVYPKSRGFTFRFRNPAWERTGAISRLKLVGANYKNGDMGRGSACDAAFLDEVRDFKKLQYFIQAVLAHQFQGRKRPLLVITSTVPWTIDHDFSRPITGYIPRAIQNGRYVVVPGSKNPVAKRTQHTRGRWSVNSSEMSGGLSPPSTNQLERSWLWGATSAQRFSSLWCASIPASWTILRSFSDMSTGYHRFSFSRLKSSRST